MDFNERESVVEIGGAYENAADKTSGSAAATLAVDPATNSMMVWLERSCDRARN